MRTTFERHHEKSRDVYSRGDVIVEGFTEVDTSGGSDISISNESRHIVRPSLTILKLFSQNGTGHSRARAGDHEVRPRSEDYSVLVSLAFPQLSDGRTLPFHSGWGRKA